MPASDRTSVAIGVTTFNRPRLVEAHARSLSDVDGLDSATLIVIDDASTECPLPFLKACFPSQARIERREANSGGADYAGRILFERLIETKADIIIVLDSDLIVVRELLTAAVRWLPATSGVLSLLNASSHPAIGLHGDFLIKQSVGLAATVWRADVARAAFLATPSGPRWDWRLCEHVRASGLKVFSVRRSLVQHLGFAEGENSSVTSGDIALGYVDTCPRNGYAIQQETLLAMQAGFHQMRKRIEALQDKLGASEARIKALELAAQSRSEKPKNQDDDR